MQGKCEITAVLALLCESFCTLCAFAVDFQLGLIVLISGSPPYAAGRKPANASRPVATTEPLHPWPALD